MLEKALPVSIHDSLRGQSGRIKVQNQAGVHHYDVVDFDVLSYWGQHRSWISGEPLQTVRCIARYSKDSREVSLLSFPGELYTITDNLTKDRGKYCYVVGNLFEDEELLTELRQAELGQTDPDPAARYEFQVKRLKNGYLLRSEQYHLSITGKNLHELREGTYQALDLHLAKTGGPFISRQQLHFTLL